MGEGQQAVKKGDRSCLRRPVRDDFRGAVKSRDKDGDSKVNKNAYQFCHDDGAEDAETSPFFCPFILFCPKILADKGGKGKGETGDGKKAEAFYLGIGAAACNCHFAKFVNVGLYNDIGKGNDGVLEPGREAVGNNLAQHRKIKADPLH